MIRRAAMVGGGVIGAGWAARLLLNGIDVAVYDPDPQAQRKLDAVLTQARSAWNRLYPNLLPAEGRLSLAPTLAEALAGAEFVQESLPEREDLKRRVLAELEASLPPDVVIASSTSGLLPTRLQADMRHPERLVVGHPFNPVYLLPLVEVCGGERTAEAAKTWATDFYRSLGMQVLLVRKEVDGFIADRLLEALWREGLWLIEEGVATTAELDDAIRYGAGLRWSFMGTFLTYRLAGGEAGMRHFLGQFGPALKLPWTKLVAPELTDELADRITEQSDAQAAGVPVRALERLRDDALVSVIQALARTGTAAGETSNAYARELAARRLPAPSLLPYEATVPPDWIDYNGHMTEHRYLQMFNDATDALLAFIGAGPDYAASGHSFYTVESHLRHLGQARAGMRLSVTTQLLGHDGKRLHLFHTLTAANDATPLATAEQMLLHVDSAAGRSAPIPGDVTDRLTRLSAEQHGLPLPEAAGRHIRMPAPR